MTISAYTPVTKSEADSSVFIEDEIKRLLDMSYDEFLRAAKANSLPDHPAVAYLLVLTGAKTSSSC